VQLTHLFIKEKGKKEGVAGEKSLKGRVIPTQVGGARKENCAEKPTIRRNLWGFSRKSDMTQGLGGESFATHSWGKGGERG